MKVIAGLGNPGKDYVMTRHNVGFMAVDKIVEKLNLGISKSKFNAVYWETQIDGEKVIILKPMTYMNDSGLAIRDIMNFYKVDPEDLLVIYDDIDIDFSDVRIRKKGSSGTHNGMKSIIYHIVSDEFSRIRIGVGKKHQGQDLAKFVLSRFSEEEMVDINNSVDLAADAAISFVKNGIENTMNHYNRKNKN